MDNGNYSNKPLKKIKKYYNNINLKPIIINPPPMDKPAILDHKSHKITSSHSNQNKHIKKVISITTI